MPPLTRPSLSLVDYHPVSGDAATAATLATMRRLAVDASRHPTLLALARQIVAEDRDGGFSGRTRAERITRWLAAHTRYVPDPTSLEVVRPPLALLRDIAEQGWAAEDCESLATLHAALLEAVGVPTRYRVLGRDPSGPYEHVLVEAWTEDGWRPYDVAARAVRLGEPLGVWPRDAVWRDAMPVAGLGQYRDEWSEWSVEGMPAPTGGTPTDVGGSDRIDWSGVVGAIGRGISAVGQAAVQVLPLLERYGVLEPVRGPSRLPLPGEPWYGYAAETGYGLTYVRRAAAQVPTWVWLAGGALLLVALTRPRRSA